VKEEYSGVALREDSYHWVRATPHFSGGERCRTFSAWRKVFFCYLRELRVFRRSLIFKQG